MTTISEQEPSADAIMASQADTYQKYLDAMAAHSIICATPGAAIATKMKAAREMAEASAAMIEAMGGPPARNLTDVRMIDHLRDELGHLTESARTVTAMLAGIDALDAFTVMGEGAVYDDFCDATTLLRDAGRVLRAAVKQADQA